MVIHAVFMVDENSTTPDNALFLRESRWKCIQAAEDTIDLIYSIFLTDDYFQTWWYNSTYTLFAVSILLALVFRRLARTQQALVQLFAHIDRAMATLQAMDDCLVARNATAIIKRTLARAKRVPQPALITQESPALPETDIGGTLHPPSHVDPHLKDYNVETMVQAPMVDGDELDDDGVGDIDWFSTYASFDENQSLFWPSWAHEIDTLGT